MKEVDVIIIGAGSAGLSARSEVAKVTDDYLIVGDGPLGTTCARVGCMPSKALIHAAEAFERRHEFEAMGISGAEGLQVDGRRVMAEVRRLRDYFVASVLRGMEKWRAEHLIEGPAVFNEQGELVVAGRTYRAKRYILTTGTTPVVPGPWQELGSALLTTDEIFELEELPGRLAVVGMGVVGTELAQAFSRLGVEVICFDPLRAYGGLTDPYVLEAAHQHLSRSMEIHHTEVQLSLEEGAVRVQAEELSWTVDRVLAAVGRRATFRDMGLEHLGIELDERGLPPLDSSTHRVPETNVYVAGDATGSRPVLHEASDGGRVAGYNAVRSENQCFQPRVAMTITFCSPQLASVGLPRRELEAGDTEFVVGRGSFDDQGRARVARELGGVVHVYAERNSGKLLGVEMAAPQAEHFAHLLAQALQAEWLVSDMLRVPFYHPTFEEGLRTALRDAENQRNVRSHEIALLRCQEPPVH